MFQVKIDNRYSNQDQSVITRQGSTVMRFYCRYSRTQLVSTSFTPAKEIVPVSEGKYTVNMIAKIQLISC